MRSLIKTVVTTRFSTFVELSLPAEFLPILYTLPFLGSTHLHRVFAIPRRGGSHRFHPISNSAHLYAVRKNHSLGSSKLKRRLFNATSFEENGKKKAVLVAIELDLHEEIDLIKKELSVPNPSSLRQYHDPGVRRTCKPCFCAETAD